ncbi:hypothetical protein KIPB_009421 [Kipferlia bialata]|uniref:Uncharacterized protein n=1 Tax=Kipferlia bialata TaxID=797122 RepID=A0A9K3CW88_9EUKA|nr:hypothetical protein KIPB_005953 [Kipferlia bialata]GIQ87390.1 hypothetical protein KIPB_009421 [Kipferlia bialata]|eukprot:g5953.t1
MPCMCIALPSRSKESLSDSVDEAGKLCLLAADGTLYILEDTLRHGAVTPVAVVQACKRNCFSLSGTLIGGRVAVLGDNRYVRVWGP